MQQLNSQCEISSFDSDDASISLVDWNVFLNETHAVDFCICVKCKAVMVEQVADVCHSRNGKFIWEVLDLRGC